MFFGAALFLRPFPGSDPGFSADLADALTGKVFGIIPASLIFLAATVLLIWIPFRRSVLGRTVYAAGSSEVAAYMSGMPIKRAKFLAYVLSGAGAVAASGMATLSMVNRSALMSGELVLSVVTTAATPIETRVVLPGANSRSGAN